MYLQSSLVELKLCNTVWVCSLLALKQLSHAGKCPWQGADPWLFRDLMKQKISLAASTSAWPEMTMISSRAILSGAHAVQAANTHIAVPDAAVCGLHSEELCKNKDKNKVYCVPWPLCAFDKALWFASATIECWSDLLRTNQVLLMLHDNSASNNNLLQLDTCTSPGLD